MKDDLVPRGLVVPWWVRHGMIWWSLIHDAMIMAAAVLAYLWIPPSLALAFHGSTDDLWPVLFGLGGAVAFTGVLLSRRNLRWVPVEITGCAAMIAGYCTFSASLFTDPPLGRSSYVTAVLILAAAASIVLRMFRMLAAVVLRVDDEPPALTVVRGVGGGEPH